ncbi:phasin [Thioalkalivibrio nitratireducens DSM 14787]|uniref:Phasin n=2 Tax=Thioalkalivibrio nitratireducens TaxID=186931 RepID=L0DV85_THIND|nr:phasin [Thioalkalivibrio nitratireducens DSM 14787]
MMIMQNQMFDAYNEMAQGVFEALRKLGEINMRAGERLLQQQLDLTNTMLEASTKGMELMTKAKGYQELMAGQAKLAQDYGQEWLKGYRGAVEVLAEARDAAAEVMDQQAQAASKNLQAAGETLKKATAKAAA